MTSSAFNVLGDVEIHNTPTVDLNDTIDGDVHRDAVARYKTKISSLESQLSEWEGRYETVVQERDKLTSDHIALISQAGDAKRLKREKDRVTETAAKLQKHNQDLSTQMKVKQ